MPRPPAEATSAVDATLLDRLQRQEDGLQKLLDSNASLWSLLEQQHETVVCKLDTIRVTPAPIPFNMPQESPPKDTHIHVANGAVGEGLREELSDVLQEDTNLDADGKPQKGGIQHHHLAHIHFNNGCLEAEYVPNHVTPIVEASVFKYFVTLLIVLNTVFVGLEMDAAMLRAFEGKKNKEDFYVVVCNYIFVIFFTLELVLRIAAYRVHFFLGVEWRWNMFDGVIVVSGLAEYALSGMNGMDSLRILRVLRLAKTLRIIRVVTVFRNLQLMLSTLLNSLYTLLWMLILLCLIVYLVTIVFMSAASSFIFDHEAGLPPIDPQITVGDEMTYEQSFAAFQKHFRTVPRGMLSLFFSVTGGMDWYDIMQPVMNVSWIYSVVYACFVGFVVFGVFNVLNAVFVETVLSNRDKDLLIQNEHLKTRVFMRDFAELFKEGDSDHDGCFSLEELEQHCKNARFCAYLNTHALDVTDAKQLFELLDVDRSGSLELEEFVLGALKLKGPARCLDMIGQQTFLNDMKDQLVSIQSALAVPQAVQAMDSMTASESQQSALMCR